MMLKKEGSKGREEGKVAVFPEDCSNVGGVVWGGGGRVGEADVRSPGVAGSRGGDTAATRQGRPNPPHPLPAAHHHLQEHEGMHRPEGLPG